MAKTRSVSSVQESGISFFTLPSVSIARISRVDPASASVDFKAELGPKAEAAFFELNGWDIPGPKTSSEKLDGNYKGGKFILTSRDKLVDAEVEIDYLSLGGFQCLRLELKGRKKKGFRRELRFSATFNQVDGCALLESYQVTCDNAAGSLKVTYIVEAEQQDLNIPDDVKATDQQRQAALEIN